MPPPPTIPHPAPDERLVFTCVNRIRRRLWITRLIERLTLALAVGAAVALGLVAARLLWDGYPLLAAALGLLPILVAACLLFIPRAKTFLPRLGGPRLSIAWAILTLLLTIAVATFGPRITQGIPLWTIPSACIAAFLAVAAFTVRPVQPRTAAIFVDQQVGLQERVATALEFLEQPSGSAAHSAFRAPVLAAAAEACHSMRSAKVGYARAWRGLYPVAGALTFAAIAVCFLTPLSANAHDLRQRNAIVVEKSKKLENLLDELEKKKSPDNAIAEKKIQPLKDALADLRKGNMSPFEADARLAQEKGELQKEQDQMDASEKVEKALDNIKGLDDVAKAGERVKDANMKGSQAGGSADAGKSKADQAVKDAAKAVGDKLKNGGMSDAEKNKLAADLQKAADQAKGDPQLKESLDKAADAAKKGDGDQLANNLGAAGQRMGEKQAEGQMSSDEVRQAMEAIDRAGREGGTQQQSAGGQDGGQSNPDGNQPQQTAGGQQTGGQQGGGGQGQKGGEGQQTASGGKSGGPGGGQKPGGQGGTGQTASNDPMGGGGSTNMHSPSAPGDHDPGHPIGGTSDYVKVYDEKSIQSQGKMEQVSGKINPLGPASGTQQILGQGDKSDATIQTYESQLPSARKRALDDLQTQQIPPQYRDLIRNYYGQ